MGNEYESTEKFWNQIFFEREMINPSTPISNIQLEKSVAWLSEKSKNILDFGCGSGRILLRSLFYGVDQVYGIDITEGAIAYATENAEKYGLLERAVFEKGGLEKLKAIKSQSFDGAILFNIIDNVLPKDGLIILKEIHRIVKKRGKVLIKFNPYIEKELREKYKFEEIEEDFYKETSGLYIWNLTDEKIKHMLQQYFAIKEEIIVEFPEHNQTNRMYYTINK